VAVEIMEKSLVNCKLLAKSNKPPWNVGMNCKTRVYKRNKEISTPVESCGLREHSIVGLCSDWLLAGVSMQNVFRKELDIVLLNYSSRSFEMSKAATISELTIHVNEAYPLPISTNLSSNSTILHVYKANVIPIAIIIIILHGGRH
jgi:hypothetical protein